MITDLVWLAFLAPLSFAVAATVPIRQKNSAALRAALATCAAAIALLTSVGAACWVGIAGRTHTGLIGARGIGFDLYLDALSAAMACLVAFVGLNIILFSRNYLQGDPSQSRFFQLLCAALACVLVLIICGNLFVLALAWIVTSLVLDKLLLFYPERRAARLAARKNAMIGRLSDVALILGIVLIYRSFGTLDYTRIFSASEMALATHNSATLNAAAIALVLAALLKSAQFPLHGWLLEVMETPTPVSALLHAGIINAGAFLVLRMSSVVSISDIALDTLAVIGAITGLFGSIVMLTQTSIKVRLAYSTIAQMGFLMLECGLAAFPAAVLHIVAHSLYKAHAFLSSGSVIDLARASWIPSPSEKPHPARILISIVAVLAVTFVMSRIAGASLLDKPGVFALSAIVLLGLIDLVANGIDERPNAYVLTRVIVLAFLTAGVFFALQIGMEHLMIHTFPFAPPLRSIADAVIVIFVVLTFGSITFFQASLSTSAVKRWTNLYAIVANGFYVNTLLNRMVMRTLIRRATANDNTLTILEVDDMAAVR